MKMIKAAVKFVCVLVILTGLYVVLSLLYQGYDLYRSALVQQSLSEKVSSLQESGSYISLEELPPTYLQAVVATEDHRFYRHSGIDIIAIARAVVNDIRAGKLVEGGSTITQQLAKNLFFTQEKVLARKIAEVFMAFEIERQYTKDEILELYVNSIYFGSNYYCVRDASVGYFGKEPGEMNADECTLLAGIPNAPSVYDLTKNPELAEQRQAQVVRKMVKYGYLTKEEAERMDTSQSGIENRQEIAA